MLQPLLPLVLLAGVGMQALWSAGPRRRVVGAVAAGLAAVLFAWTAFDVSVNEGTDPRELLVVVYTDPDALEVRDRVLALARRDPGLTVTVDGTDHSTFPWAWYFRDLHTGYVDMRRTGYKPAADVLVMSDAAHDRLAGTLGAYDARRFTQRRFWGRTYDALTPALLWRWMRTREPWDAGVGSLDSFLLVRAKRPAP